MPVDNNTFQKNANTSLVANYIWKKKHISRAAIAKELNLYRSTVTNIVSNLLEKGVLIEGERCSSTQLGGRRAIELSINPDFGCIFGFDIQHSYYRAVLLQAEGTEIWRETGSFGQISLEEMISKAVDLALNVHQKFNKPIIAISFSIPGIVSKDYSKIIKSEPFNAENIDVASIVKEKIDCPVFVENDANTAAWLDVYNIKVAGNAISVISNYQGKGVNTGLGVIIAGNVYRGTHNAAGEYRSSQAKEDSWLEDLFKFLVPILSVMDIGGIVFHGRPFSDVESIKAAVAQKVPEFFEIINNANSKVVFDTEDECLCAVGAAMMSIQKMFSIPNLLDAGNSNFISWEENIALLQKQSEK